MLAGILLVSRKDATPPVTTPSVTTPPTTTTVAETSPKTDSTDSQNTPVKTEVELYEVFMRYASREVTLDWNYIYNELTNWGLHVNEVATGGFYVSTTKDDEQSLIMSITKDGINYAYGAYWTETETEEAHYLFELQYSNNFDFAGGLVVFKDSGDEYFICDGINDPVQVGSLDEINAYLNELSGE